MLIKKNLIGVDIGSYSVKIVALEGASGAYTLKSAAYFKLPKEGDAHASLTPGLLSGILMSQKVKGRRAAALMSGPSLIFKHLHLPQMPEKDLKEAIRWEIRKDLAISVSASELVSDYMIAGKGNKPGENTLSIIAFAAVRSDIERLITLFKGSGLDLRVLDVVPSALLFAFDMNNAWEEGVNYAMLDIGESKTTLAILKDRKLFFAREITIGGSDLTGALAREMKRSEDESEEYKIAFGLTSDEGEDNAAKRTLTTSVERLCSEVQRSFDYFQAQFREGAVSKVFLSGGTARLKGIEAFITGYVGIPCFTDDPFRSLKIPKSFDTRELTVIAPCLTVATGLAVRTG